MGVLSTLSFVIFGLGSLVVACLFMPLIWLAPVSRQAKKRAARKVIKTGFWMLRWLLRIFWLVRTRAVSLEHIPRDRGCVIIANHQTIYDVSMLMSFCPESICIIKHSLMKIPFFSLPAKLAGFIPNIQSEQILDACMRELDSGTHIILFPEGTRADPFTLLPFKRGAANLAIRGGHPVLPVFASYKSPTLYKGQKCYDCGDRMCDVTLKFSTPIDTHRYCETTKSHSVAARKLTQDLEKMYRDELGWAGKGERE